MTSKTEENYKRVIRRIREITSEDTGQHLSPAHIHCDFELAEVNSLRAEFIASEIHECLFHLLDSWHRKLVELGFKTDLEKKPAWRDFWTLLCGIPNLDVTHERFRRELPSIIRTASDQLGLENQNAKDRFESFVEYLLRNYLEDNSLFKPSEWSHGKNILTNPDFSRTNNVSESTNNQLNRNFPIRNNWNSTMETLRKHKIKTTVEFFSHQPIKVFGLQPRKPYKRKVRSYDAVRLEKLRERVVEFSTLTEDEQFELLQTHLFEMGRLRRFNFNNGNPIIAEASLDLNQTVNLSNLNDNSNEF